MPPALRRKTAVGGDGVFNVLHTLLRIVFPEVLMSLR